MISRRWRVPLLTLAVVIAWLLFWFWDTAAAMVDIWSRSDTFMHAFLVPPISLWLIWRKREELVQLVPAGSIWAVLLAVVPCFAWLLGELAAVNVVTQFALVSLIILAVPATLGWRVARAITFPLLFLFFAVPFGEFVMPQLMQWTAKFAVMGLQLSGIPVYQEGLSFVIPSGRWSVIEACSGIRYLLASLTIGTLYAYLNYVSPWRRAGFMVASLLVPVAANWVRAYMIVMLGHYSGNTLAVGVDHLIYGWVFFGIVITAMFAIGARWAEDPLPVAPIGDVPAQIGAGRMRPLAVGGVLLLVLVIAPLWVRGIDQQRSSLQPDLSGLAQLPAEQGWALQPASNDLWQPSIQNPSEKYVAEWSKNGRRIGLYVAYFRNQDYQRKLVSSENMLVTSTDADWHQTAEGMVATRIDGQSTGVRVAELRSTLVLGSLNPALRVWRWYWVGGRMTESDARAKLYVAWSRLTGQGDDGAIVVLHAMEKVEGESDSLLADFLNAEGPALSAALERVRAAR